MSGQYRNFMGYMWVTKEDNIYTVGLSEEGIEEIDSIESLDLPKEGEEVDADVVCGAVETDEGSLDLYAPVSGEVIEINSSVLEEPSLIQDDPLDAWLFKIESDEDMDDEDNEDDDDEDEDDEDDEDLEDEDEDEER